MPKKKTLKRVRKTVRKTVTRTVSKKKCCSFKPLAWLAAFFGVAIVLVTVAAYKNQAGVDPMIMVANPPVALGQWEFTSAIEGWQARNSGTEAYCIWVSVGPGESKKECDKGTTGSAIALTVANGNLKFGGMATFHTRLLNNKVELIVPATASAVIVQVKMKAKFTNFANRNAAVTKNEAKLEISNLVQPSPLSDTASATVSASGEAVYSFRFTKGKMDANKNFKGTIKKIHFYPTTEATYQLRNVMIDRISVLTKN